jgi:hypothetical protein
MNVERADADVKVANEVDVENRTEYYLLRSGDGREYGGISALLVNHFRDSIFIK